jgi:hypothetical protein
MVTLRKAIGAAALVCGLAGTALAGPVQVFGTWARGDLGAAHNASSAAYVGCWVSTDSTGPALAYCEANDGVGNFNFCYTQNPHLLNTISSMTSSSELVFGWDASHVCVWLTVAQFSQSPGRKP